MGLQDFPIKIIKRLPKAISKGQLSLCCLSWVEVSPRIPFDGHINQNGACPTFLTPSLSEKSQVPPDAGHPFFPRKRPAHYQWMQRGRLKFPREESYTLSTGKKTWHSGMCLATCTETRLDRDPVIQGVGEVVMTWLYWPKPTSVSSSNNEKFVHTYR